MSKIRVQDIDLTLINLDGKDYISLTEMVASNPEGSKIIERWMNTKNTVDFLGAWENFYNPNFNSPEFRGIRENVGSGGYFLSIKKWIDSTNAIGLTAKAGRYGGTFANVDIALEFASYVSPVFKLLLITEFKKFKETESETLRWDVRRYISKVNYKIQTDAVKSVLIPLRNLPKQNEGVVYAEEADLLYDAMFGYISSEWRKKKPRFGK
ncbi:KilA-N domain-containing protein [Pedobacter frigiditerrae]|uniref:KilA-N domain-containing protein n=1 Tax=Pedobacter frigiditerrae TaxID=2530452 RepID=UPI002930669F|nr:KilA-N domain-containing protein [Pedobacter frigiditerrae]